MKKITKILVPIDFSTPSENAFRYALLLADKIGASLEIINVVPVQGGSLDYPGLVAQATQQNLETARIRLKKVVDKTLAATGQLLQEAPMISFDLEIGTPVQTICDIAQRQEATMIIMGSRGKNKSQIEKLFGSVAAGVVEKAKCAVMVIPEEFSFSNIEKIIYSTNVNNADPFEIWKTLDLLHPFRPSVDVLHINLKKEGGIKDWGKLEKMKLFFEEKEPELEINFHHRPGTNIQSELNEFVEKNLLDILVMYQPHHDFWDRLFYKSETKEMTQYTKIPLLVLKEE